MKPVFMRLSKPLKQSSGSRAGPGGRGHNVGMYQPPQFNSKDREYAACLMREHAFASLISNDDDGLPFVTHLPLHLEDRDGAFHLLGHCARANPHWKYLKQRPTAVVTFLGPHAYQSPRIYPDLARVPMPSHNVYRDRLLGAVAHGDGDRDQAVLAREQARACGL